MGSLCRLLVLNKFQKQEGSNSIVGPTLRWLKKGLVSIYFRPTTNLLWKPETPRKNIFGPRTVERINKADRNSFIRISKVILIIYNKIDKSQSI
jgi:hypothetical protein